MHVRVELTKRIAELAGFRQTEIEIGCGETLGDLLNNLAGRFRSSGANELIDQGSLHPSILVVVDGTARTREHHSLALYGRESIDLLLPIAGG